MSLRSGFVMLVFLAGCQAAGPARGPAAPPGGAEPKAAEEPEVATSSPAGTDTPETASGQANEDALLARILPPPNGSARRDVPGCPVLPDSVKAGVAAETAKAPELRGALVKLDPALEQQPNGHESWFQAVEELATARAVFGLSVALCHPHDDVKLASVKALAKIGDRRPVPFLLLVADSFAVMESGSENATIHGVLQHELAQALNVLTGAQVKLARGQDPTGLRNGIRIWQKALSSQTP
jgi:hypothetical protein